MDKPAQLDQYTYNVWSRLLINKRDWAHAFNETAFSKDRTSGSHFLKIVLLDFGMRTAQDANV